MESNKKDLQAKQSELFYKVDIVVIGAGQAGLSAAYHLKKRGIKPGKGKVYCNDFTPACQC